MNGRHAILHTGGFTPFCTAGRTTRCALFQSLRPHDPARETELDGRNIQFDERIEASFFVEDDRFKSQWQLGVSLSMTSAAALRAAADKLTPEKENNSKKQELNADKDGRSPLIRLAIRPFSSRRHVHLLMLLCGELYILFMGLSCPPLPFTSVFVPVITENVPVKFPRNTPLTFDNLIFCVYNKQAR